MSFSLDNLKKNTLTSIEDVMKKLPGEKHMLVEPGLLRALDSTVSMRFLSSLGVKKVFKIQDLPPEASLSRLVYVVPPTKQSVRTVIAHAEMDRKAGIQRNKLVAFAPKHTVAVKTLMESRGVLGHDLQIADLSFGWIPIDTDLISLNLPEVYTSYFLYGDTSWPYHFGQMLGHVLEIVLPPGQAPTDINLHAFGSAAQVAAAGLSSEIGRIKATKPASFEMAPDSTNQECSSAVPFHHPMFILFSRNLDYVTPLMVPTTFEALIHEVIGIDNGVVELPDVQKGDIVPAKLNLSSSNISCFKEVRNAHISTVHKWLQAQRSQLEDSRTGLGFSLAALDRSLPGSGSSPRVPSAASLSDLSAQLKPILAVRRDLTALLICFEEVMKKMANEERVEDLLSAQTTILLSGSGGALAMPLGREILPNESDDQMPPEAATGTCADEATCQPFRLALEWLSTRFGDRLTEAVRLLCLLSITHDGLSEELYTQVLRHIQHAVGFSIYPMLAALRRLKLLHPRRRDPASEAASSSSSNFRLGLTPVSTEKIVSATERLMRRRKSVYNRLHRFLQLSLKSQVNLSVEKPAVSPSYVFGGQHVPVVVRLAESLWATSLAGDSGAGRSQFSGLELLKREQLTEALRLLHTDERSAKNLGHVSLTEASEDSTAAADSSTTTTKTTTLSHGQTMVVAFVGGCTYAEVAALRFAASRRCWRLLIVTSQMLSTKSLIQQVGQAAL